MIKKKKKRRRRRKKPVDDGKVIEGGRVSLYLNQDMWDALLDVNSQMRQLKGVAISYSTIVRMYLEKGLIADRALPRPPREL